MRLSRRGSVTPKTGSITFLASSVTGSRATGSPLASAATRISGFSVSFHQRPFRTMPTSSARAGRAGPSLGSTV